jgi:AraC-like DNA-binding protein
MYPDYLFEYPNRQTLFPFYMKKKSYQAVAPHRHDFIELSYVAAGSGLEIINGSEHPMIPGTFVLLLPFHIHSFRSTPGESLTLYTCNFPIDLLTEGKEAELGLAHLLTVQEDSSRSFVMVPESDRTRICHLLDEALSEFEADIPYKHLVLKGKLLEALALFLRYRSLPSADDPAVPSSGISTKAKLVTSIVQYMYQQYMEPLSLAQVARHFHITPAYLSDLFHKQYGIHFVDFLHELRVRHACSLLLSSDMPIAEVWVEAGFGSYPSFCRNFHKVKGMGARDYRDSQHQKRLFP